MQCRSLQVVSSAASACSLFLALLVLSPAPLRAQFTSGVDGTVTDATQAVVPEVKLELINTDTGVTLATLTNSSGRFHFIDLPPGHYTLKASKTGFRVSVQERITLESGRIADIPLKLEVGSISQEVAVQADVAPVETTNPTISAVVTNDYVNNIPTGNRNVYNLIGLTPGVTGIVNQPGTTNDAFQIINGTARANANGARVNANGYYVDGSSVNDMADGGGAKLTPNPDAVEEVRFR
ncbi:MAG: carboxypeptidase regulatory-like domain-containing protein [Acidobacteriia bacterium]|nr:carboxypeptidase regulatory-like domain-containing protein [Terriglobia bacterium]